MVLSYFFQVFNADVEVCTAVYIAIQISMNAHLTTRNMARNKFVKPIL